MTDALERILILEDNVPLALEWKTVFELNHFDVTLTHTALEAIAFLEKEKFDLIIADLFINGRQDGLSVLVQRFKMPRPKPPVISVTGSFIATSENVNTNLLLEQAKRLGSALSIQKPFLAGELVALAREVLD